MEYGLIVVSELPSGTKFHTYFLKFGISLIVSFHYPTPRKFLEAGVKSRIRAFSSLTLNTLNPFLHKHSGSVMPPSKDFLSLPLSLFPFLQSSYSISHYLSLFNGNCAINGMKSKGLLYYFTKNTDFFKIRCRIVNFP